MYLSQSEQLVFLRSADHVTSEVSYLPIDDFSATPVMISPRSSGHEYDVEHYQDQLLIRSNQRHANFDLFTAPLTAHSQAQWQPFLEGTTTIISLGIWFTKTTYSYPNESTVWIKFWSSISTNNNTSLSCPRPPTV